MPVHVVLRLPAPAPCTAQACTFTDLIANITLPPCPRSHLRARPFDRHHSLRQLPPQPEHFCLGLSLCGLGAEVSSLGGLRVSWKVKGLMMLVVAMVLQSLLRIRPYR